MSEKNKMTDAQIHKAKKLAEDLKSKPGILNPHALSRWLVQKKKGKKQ